jgi:hypothetical protein
MASPGGLWASYVSFGDIAYLRGTGTAIMTDPGRAWRIGAPELVFGIVLVSGLLGGRAGFFNDPGTFWHVRLGREILRTGQVPRFDTLTATRAGTPWVDQSWLFDVGLAWVVERLGWAGVTALVAVGLACVYRALACWLIGQGRSPLVASVVAIVAAGVGSIHFLARPHLFTYAFVLATLALCRARHERGSRGIWFVPWIVAVWANLHGGFLAGPLIVAMALGGEAISGAWDAARRRRLATFGIVLVLSMAAPLLNPYGVGLYRHVAELLYGSGVTDLIDEYRPAPFGRGEARVLEWVILALIALPLVSKGRPERYDLVLALGWLHLALGSIRHAPFFAMAAAPVLASLLDGLPGTAVRREGASSDASGGGWAWPVAAGLVLLVAVGSGLPLGGPDAKRWPMGALARLNAMPVGAPMFHEQDWGGLIELECEPSRAAYLDDRFELWGRGPIVEYLDVLRGGPAWEEVRDRDGIALVWVRPDRGLAKRLLREPGWQVVHRDGGSILFRRGEELRTARVEARREVVNRAPGR